MGNSESTIKKRLEGKPVVLIVGGGFGGIQVAKALDAHCNVILIDRKDYFFINIGALRSSVDTNFVEKIMVPYDKLLKFGYVIQAEVSNITDTGVFVKGREEAIKFDYLVISTGTSYAFPSKVAIPEAKDILPLYQESAEAIKSAQSILIIGGGPVGVELLGEISYKHPNKKITLVQSQADIIPGKFNPRLREELAKKIANLNKNAKLITGERVIMDDELKGSENRFISRKMAVKTDKGSEIETDLVFFCGGAKVNNSSFSKSFEKQVDSNGRLKVNQFLQVEGYEKIFSIGDCANVPEGKMAYTAGLQGTAAGKNIHLHIQGKSLKEYKPSPHAGIFVTLSPKDGVAQFPTSGGTVVGSKITSMIKGDKLFTNVYWSELNHSNSKVGEVEKPDDEDVSRMANLLRIAEADARKMIEGLEVSQRDQLSVDHT